MLPTDAGRISLDCVESSSQVIQYGLRSPVLSVFWGCELMRASLPQGSYFPGQVLRKKISWSPGRRVTPENHSDSCCSDTREAGLGSTTQGTASVLTVSVCPVPAGHGSEIADWHRSSPALNSHHLNTVSKNKTFLTTTNYFSNSKKSCLLFLPLKSSSS